MIACKYCGEPIPPKKKSQPGPQRTTHKKCWKREYRRSPKGRISYVNELIRRKAAHASKNLRPWEKVSDEEFVLSKRGSYEAEQKFIKRRSCIVCGDSFFGGNAAVRCRVCEVGHRREQKRGYYLRSKGR